MQQGKSFPIYVDIKGIKSMTTEATLYFATEGMVDLKAIALVCDHPVSIITARLFLKFKTLPHPTRIFYNRHSALQYLHAYA
ncbi:hypothetical protein ACG2LH_17640 [Zhouia sp. PK063]|uniref:DUF7793 family protein n=1 Tax=Zhouia sp. PK063 TaxID=3373602 RepID=UPI00378F62CD